MTIYEYGNKSALTVLIQPVDEQELSHIDDELKKIQQLSGKDFHFVAVKVDDWNHDLSPWKIPAVFGREDFGDGAKDTLREILKLCEEKNKKYIIGGYSLAALFSLWASYQTDVFSAVAAASPSIWFPGFVEYMKANKTGNCRIYLSLGDKEEKTENPIVATVAECICKAYEILKNRGIKSVLEWNNGNHFKEADLRTAKAFAWALKEADYK